MHISKQHIAIAGSVFGISLAAVSGLAGAVPGKAANATNNDQQHLSAIIGRGDKEISRRLASLTSLTAKINASYKLTNSDKASLTAEITNETNGLTALKAKLDADTTLSDAKADAQSIVKDYRVYALIVPKIQFVKQADDQQAVETKLSALATKLQARLDSAKAAGKDTSSLQAKLDDMKTQTGNAQTISTAIEAKVSGLQPTDYNNDHSVLSGDAAQLKTARGYTQAATADAKAIVAGVKTL